MSERQTVADTWSLDDVRQLLGRAASLSLRRKRPGRSQCLVDRKTVPWLKADHRKLLSSDIQPLAGRYV